MSAPLITNSYSNKSPAESYALIEQHFSGFNGHTMPMSFRKLIQVQLSAATVTEENRLGDNRSRHIKAFMAGTIGAAFTAVTRIIRIAVFTACLLPAIPVRYATASRYGIDGVIPELFRKYFDEWIDLGVTALSIPLALARTFSPNFASDMTNRITHYYLTRADRRAEFAVKETEAKREYDRLEARAKNLRDQADRTSVKQNQTTSSHKDLELQDMSHLRRTYHSTSSDSDNSSLFNSTRFG